MVCCVKMCWVLLYFFSIPRLINHTSANRFREQRILSIWLRQHIFIVENLRKQTMTFFIEIKYYLKKLFLFLKKRRKEFLFFNYVPTWSLIIFIKQAFSILNESLITCQCFYCRSYRESSFKYWFFFLSMKYIDQDSWVQSSIEYENSST